MVPQKIIKFFEAANAKYELINHKTVYTAYDKAVTLRLKEAAVAKTLVVKLDKEFCIVVLSACYNLDKNKLKQVVNMFRKKHGMNAVKSIDFAKEQWIKKNLKGVQVGAVPPFGNLFGFFTLVDGRLLKQPKIVVNGGSYNVSIKLTQAVYKKLVSNLVIGSFGKKR